MQCKQCQQEFAVRSEDKIFYGKIDVPPPTHCPDCRAQRRMAWRNERTLYAGQCDLCHKNIISVYHPSNKFPVYCSDCWYSDAWDQRSYGRDFDFGRPFFEQFAELQSVAPHLNLVAINNVNCDFINYGANDKNCYLSFSVMDSEDILYSRNIDSAKDLIDCEDCWNSELLYNCLNCEKCFASSNLILSANLTDCHYCYNCNNCQNCFGAVNLRNQEYVWFGQKLTAEEYSKRLLEVRLSYQQELVVKNKFNEMLASASRRYAIIRNSVDCSGDYIFSSKNIFKSYQVKNSEDCAYGDRILGEAKDCYDVYADARGERHYEMVAGVGSYNNMFTFFCSYSDSVSYSSNCVYGKNLFGCVGAHHQKFCIFNKQYDETEYKKLKEKIIQQMRATGEYGEFFPISLAPVAYNESIAQEYFPLTREEVLSRGWLWREDLPGTKGKETLKVLPDNIKDVPDEIVKEILACVSCKKNYKITPQELAFYQKQNLPLPRKCSDCRHLERSAWRNPRHLWSRQCDCQSVEHGHGDRCSVKFETTYALDRPEAVYCEECYQKEIY